MQSVILTCVCKVWSVSKMTMCRGITIYWSTGSDWYSYSYHYTDYWLTAFSVDTGGKFIFQTSRELYLSGTYRGW